MAHEPEVYESEIYRCQFGENLYQAGLDANGRGKRYIVSLNHVYIAKTGKPVCSVDKIKHGTSPASTEKQRLPWIKEMNWLQVYDITLAYESGYGQGLYKEKPGCNYYEEGTPSHVAYDIGVKAGQKKKGEEA